MDIWHSDLDLGSRSLGDLENGLLGIFQTLSTVKFLNLYHIVANGKAFSWTNDMMTLIQGHRTREPMLALPFLFFVFFKHLLITLSGIRAASPGGSVVATSVAPAPPNHIPPTPQRRNWGNPRGKLPYLAANPASTSVNGHPSKYRPGPTLLNFRDLTRTGVSNVLVRR